MFIMKNKKVLLLITIVFGVVGAILVRASTGTPSINWAMAFGVKAKLYTL